MASPARPSSSPSNVFPKAGIRTPPRQSASFSRNATHPITVPRSPSNESSRIPIDSIARYTPGFIANVEEVKQLLLEADGFYGSGRFDLAFKRYEQVLNIDKYNIAARRGMERVNLARQRYATTAYNEARGDMLTQVDKSWELPVRRFEVGASTIIEQPQIDTRGTSLINRKLDEIIIPRVDFRDATIREALDFLKQRSVALDTTDQDPSRRGINIVLKVPADSPEADARITLSLNDIPLRAAIDYVAKAANLKLKDRTVCGRGRSPVGADRCPDHQGIQSSSRVYYIIAGDGPGASARSKEPTRLLLARNPPFRLDRVRESFWRLKG